MSHLPDALGFDALSDELAVDFLDRPYNRPSDFPSARAFVAATSVAGSSPVTRSPVPGTTGEHSTAPGALTPSPPAFPAAVALSSKDGAPVHPGSAVQNHERS